MKLKLLIVVELFDDIKVPVEMFKVAENNW